MLKYAYFCILRRPETTPKRAIKNPANPCVSMVCGIFSFGDPAGIRTPDTLLKRQVLCQLSYWVKTIYCKLVRIIWLGWPDSNQRMRESKSRALPLGDTPL